MNENVAGQGPLERPVRPGSEARWYCLDRDGVAMLCKDEADARAQVIENSDCWPNRTPYRAALLGDVEALEAENAALKREAHTWWTAAEHYARRQIAREGQAEDLHNRLHSLSKAMESSGRIDEHEHPDAYGTILDAMKYVQPEAERPETQPGAPTFDGADAWNAHGA